MAAKDDFARVDVPTVLDSADPECLRFGHVLEGRARELTEKGEKAAARVASVLATVCSFALRHDNGRAPFGPKVVQGDRRSTSIEDLTDEDVVLLAEFWDAVAIPELRARVADVLFLRQRHHDFGKAAIAAYLDTGRQLLTPEKWAQASFRFCRAIKIAGAVKSERERVTSEIVAELEKRRGDQRLFSARMLNALFDARLGDPVVMSTLGRDGAEQARKDKDWDRAREYWEVFARWSRRTEKPADETQGRLEAAECYVNLADGSGSRGVQTGFLERAIQSLRELPGTGSRVAELHRRLVAAGEGILAELSQESRALDLGRMPDEARAAVSGRSLLEAVFELTALFGPTDVQALQRGVQAAAAQSPFAHSISRVMIDRDGRVLGRRGSLLDGTPEERQEAMRLAMFERARSRRTIAVAGMIEPARELILEQHYVSAPMLLPLTCASAFVPAGRENVFAEGLAAGFNGDFATSLCVLIPQFEHAVRSWMARAGVLTSKIDGDGIQDVRYLPDLLTCEEASRSFGGDLVFEMRGLLVERFGSNLRNQLAHGLLLDHEMRGPESIYFWWLTLHMTCRSAASESPHSEPPSSESEGPGEDAGRDGGPAGRSA